MKNTYKAGKVVEVTEDSILYRMPHVSGTKTNSYLTYLEPFKVSREIPDCLEISENILNNDEWKKLISERSEYMDGNKGSLRLSVFETSISDLTAGNKTKPSIQLQITNPDILVVKGYTGKSQGGKKDHMETYDIVGISGIDRAKTMLNYRHNGENVVMEMKYDSEVLRVLERSLSMFLDEPFIEDYPFLNIEAVKPEDAGARFKEKRRTVFALFPNLEVKDYMPQRII